MPPQAPSLYKKYHIDRNDERVGLFRLLVESFDIKTALYPGSFVHFAPSFVIPEVVYVDSYKKAKPVFDSRETLEYIDYRKEYKERAAIKFIYSNFTEKLDLQEQSFDLLISQYAGLISFHCKQYLKIGGLLIANNSHGDASMAFLDRDYELIGVVNNRGSKYNLSDKNLAEYFIPKKGIQVTKKELRITMKSVGYTKSADNYLFRKTAK